MIWHSRDLVNWRPAARVPMTGLEFTYYKGKYYVYTFRGGTGGVDPRYANLSWSQRTLLGTTTLTGGNHEFSTFVSYADCIDGPWSQPAEIGFYGMIDPGFVADQQGNRYLFHNMGLLINLTPRRDEAAQRGRAPERRAGVAAARRRIALVWAAAHCA